MTIAETERIWKILESCAIGGMMENYNLMWGDFTSNLSLTVKDLRNDADFLDVSIACEDDTIDAHKVILSAASPFFRNILRKNKHPHPYIYLNGVKLKDMKNLIVQQNNNDAENLQSTLPCQWVDHHTH